MAILSVENISKTYGEKILFENISFTINENDKIGLIGINGTGKSTLLKIIAGYEPADSGSVNIPKGFTIEFLSQNPEFDSEATVLEQVLKGDSPIMKLIQEYELTLEQASENPNNTTIQEQLLKLTSNMNTLEAWDIETQVKTILTKLGISEFNKKIKTLSGGQKKRVALCHALITPCDLLILDEPTNHMDNDTIDWLEKHLKNRTGSFLMITHDRYFLDRIVNKTFELNYGKLYAYTCNYSEFLEKKLERQTIESSVEKKRLALYKKELAWIRTGAKARSTKQKARIQRFEELADSGAYIDDSELDISVAHSRLGDKIIEMNNVSKHFGENYVIKDFSYILLKDDRIGVVGNNGMGKSTLLNLITGKQKVDSGFIDIGSTVKIGYFSQESADMDVNLRAIDYIKETAEYVTTSDGAKISASQMMERFLFPDNIQYSYIQKLSGGEKRRLYLLKILMDAPNILILDEPTNDLDIDTLKVLENYIDNFNGVVISVSHDRYFLDRTCNKIFAFEGNGKITEYPGNYTDFLGLRTENITPTPKEKSSSTNNDSNNNTPKPQKLKFSYNEKVEYEKIDGEIETLENQLAELEDEIKLYASEYTKLQELSDKKDSLEEQLLFKMERQEYLSNLEKQIESLKNPK